MCELALVYLEELDLHVPVQDAFERQGKSSRLTLQRKRFHRLGQMHKQPFTRRVGAADGHGASMHA